MVTTIRLPDELHRVLKEQAGRKGMTLNAYLLNILWEVREGEERGDNYDEGKGGIHAGVKEGR